MQCQVLSYESLDYRVGLEEQAKHVTALQEGSGVEALFLLQHPHVITLPKGKKPLNLLADQDLLKKRGVEFFETRRGGDITYHGPGQLVGYPILKLTGEERKVKKYIHLVEEVIIQTIFEFGIESGRIEGLSGVWVGDEKIAAIGIRFSRWVTSHGFALNVNPDLSYFNLIRPCGIQGKGVTSMSEVLGKNVSVSEVKAILINKFSQIMGRQIDGI